MNTLEDYKYVEDSEAKYPSIVDNFIHPSPSVVDRYFTRYYRIFPVKEDEDHLILLLSNRICLIGLAPNHIALKKGVAKIRYDIGNIDRGSNQVKGKSKKGGMALQPNSTIAIVECKDGSEYRIQSCVTGKLIEMNKKINDDPDILKNEERGYIAILLIKPENTDFIKDNLFTKVQYEMAREPPKIQCDV